MTPVLGSVTTGTFDIDNPVADADTDVYHVTVPAGTLAVRFSLDSADDTADLDLFVYTGGELIAVSATEAADEQVTLLTPPEGTYDVYVNGYATRRGSTSYGVSNFVVDAGDAGNATVTPNPAAVTAGSPLTLTATWTGLDPAKRWLGVISYQAAGLVTLLSVN